MIKDFAFLRFFNNHSSDYITFDSDTYKLDIGGYFEFRRLVTRGGFDHPKIKTKV